MIQQVDARVLLTYSAEAALSAAALSDAIRADVARLQDGGHGGALSLHCFTVESIAEEAAIYRTDEAARLFIPAVHVEPAPDIVNPYPALRAGVEGLRSAVSHLMALYERMPAYNELQPQALAGCFAASLDEWIHRLGGALDELDGLGRWHDQLAALGFQSELGGGGCTFLSTYRNGAAVWLTCEDGPDYPTPESWCVGVYPPPGPDGDMPEALWLMRSDALCQGEAGAARMLDAARAAIATAEALADALPEADAPSDEPCPVNRRPKSTCPDSCDHGIGGRG